MSIFDRGRATHRSARAVAGRSEGLFHRAWLADEQPTGGTHRARDEYWLTDRAVRVGNLRMVRWKCTGRTLAMYAHLCLATIHGVLFKFCDVVCHVIDELHVELFPGTCKNAFEHFPGLVHEQLTIA